MKMKTNILYGAALTRKNRRNDPDRLTLRKYNPVVGRHVGFREER